MINLFDETVDILKENDKSIIDVEWFGTLDNVFNCDIRSLFDFEYDNGYGGHFIPLDLIVVGDGFWLERGEYDGSEWWEYKKFPEKPSTVISPFKLLGSH